MDSQQFHYLTATGLILVCFGVGKGGVHTTIKRHIIGVSPLFGPVVAEVNIQADFFFKALFG